MKKIKVWLQYPWKFPDSPYYKYLVDNPPKEIEYLNVGRQKGVITKKKKFLFSNKLKGIIRKATVSFKLAIPNAHFTKSEKEFDLIHCAHCLSLNKKPWVADFEGVWQFSVSGKQTKTGKKLIRNIIKKRNCKKIIAWTKEAKKNILKEFPDIKEKVEIVYPAVSVSKIKKEKHKGINLLFVGRYFYEKGGFHALRAVDILTRKYENVKAIIVSEVPKEVMKKYSQNKKIKFYGLMPQKELFGLCSKSDIFVYPGYSDSFGFGILEAMSFGIPIITVHGFSRKEIVQDKKTGFVIDRKSRWYPKKKEEGKIIKELVDKTSLLIKDKKLLKKMSKNCTDIIKKGKFSIKERNKKLREIYKEVVKNG